MTEFTNAELRDGLVAYADQLTDVSLEIGREIPEELELELYERGYIARNGDVTPEGHAVLERARVPAP